MLRSLAKFNHRRIFGPISKQDQINARSYAKEIKFGNEVRRLMLQGVDILAKSVSVTMGPKGRNVIFDEKPNKLPRVTKDGHTVAKQILLKDKFQNIGSQLVLEATNCANNDAGDGTTTTAVLTQAIATEAHNAVTKGSNPNEIKKGIKLAVDCVSESLKKMSKPVKTKSEIVQIATVSANGDSTIGDNICKAMEKVGSKGVIKIKDGDQLEDTLEFIEGFQFDCGYSCPHFINTIKGSRVELKDPYILIINKRIVTARPLLPSLEIARKNRKPLVVIAEDIRGEALGALYLNKVRNGIEVGCIKAPSDEKIRKEILQDISAITGGIIFADQEMGAIVSKAKESDLGRIGEIVISKDETLMMKYKGNKERITQRVEELKLQLKNAKRDSEADNINDRIGKLTTGIAVIKVGGCSEVEISMKKDRYVDALNATRAALEEGVVPGGGTALLKTIPLLKDLNPKNQDQKLGIEVVMSALKTPCMTIIKNASSGDPTLIIEKVLKEPNTVGYDVMSEKITDLFKKGIVDSTKVIRTALIKAASVASMLATAEAVIITRPKPPPKKKKMLTL